MGFLAGKRALIVGIASQRSIAWGIAQAMHSQGAELAFTYQNDRLRDRVEEAARHFGSDIVLPCDVASDEEIGNLFTALGERWDGLDILVHSVGFAPREALQGEFLDGLTRENFAIAHDISSYSLAALAKAARPLMAQRQGAILTMTYLGAVRALANYNVMGLAKASLESSVRYLAYNLGPEGTGKRDLARIRTAASGVGNSQDARPSNRSRRCAKRHHRDVHAIPPPSCARPGCRHHRRDHLRDAARHHRHAGVGQHSPCRMASARTWPGPSAATRCPGGGAATVLIAPTARRRTALTRRAPALAALNAATAAGPPAQPEAC